MDINLILQLIPQPAQGPHTTETRESAIPNEDQIKMSWTQWGLTWGCVDMVLGVKIEN